MELHWTCVLTACSAWSCQSAHLRWFLSSSCPGSVDHFLAQGALDWVCRWSLGLQCGFRCFLLFLTANVLSRPLPSRKGAPSANLSTPMPIWWFEWFAWWLPAHPVCIARATLARCPSDQVSACHTRLQTRSCRLIVGPWPDALPSRKRQRLGKWSLGWSRKLSRWADGARWRSCC